MRWARLSNLGAQHQDYMIAAVFVAMGSLEAVVHPDLSWQRLITNLLFTVPLAWRRRWPIPVLAVVVASVPLSDILLYPRAQEGEITYVLAVQLAAYTVGRHLDPPATWWGPGLSVGLSWVLSYYQFDSIHTSDLVFPLVLWGMPWWIGFALRQRAIQIAQLAEEADQLRQLQAEREQRAVAEERARIARELHDIISHSISVISIQTQAVRRRLRPDQVGEADDLHAVEATAREAMVEMRRLFGVLRAEGDPIALTPQPGLDQLPRLIEETRAIGIPVEVRVQGTVVPLSPGMDLAAYRIVQEALTNIRRHAHGAATTITLKYADHGLDVLVENEGSAMSADPSPNGQGLIGIRERVMLYGGMLRVGPGTHGGFAVHVTLPLHEQTQR
jgi:signal transduction histidine kinase